MTRLHPIIVVTVFGAIAAFCVSRVQFSASLYEMLPPDLPEVQGMDRLNRFFSRDGQLIVTVKSEEAWLAGEALDSLAAHLEGHPQLVAEVYRELSLTELVTEGGGLLAWLWLNAPPEELKPLLNRLDVGASAAAIAASMESLQSGFFDQKTIVTSYDPLGFSKLGGMLGVEDGGSSGPDPSGPDPMTSPDGTFHVMYVEGSGVDFSNYRDAAVWLKKIKGLVSEWNAAQVSDHPGGKSVTVGLTGTPAFMAEVGAEMERDMTVSVFLTMILISLLFFLMHRKTRPLSFLVSAMLAILAMTILVGGLLFGDLSVMSAGFAAILMGLAVDYGIVIYREAMGGKKDARELRRTVGPGILWAAATTAVVFLSLNFSSLPGLSEMGNLVAIGVGIGAVVMLFGFAPVAVGFASDEPVPQPGVALRDDRRFPLAGAVAVLLPALAILSVFGREVPVLEANFHPFRIRESPSMIAWQDLQAELRGREHAVPTVITGKTMESLLEEVAQAKVRIEAASDSGLLIQSVLPTAFLPNPTHQKSNANAIRQSLSHRDRILTELTEAGFSEDGAKLTRTIFDSWENYLGQLADKEYSLPVGKLAEWSISRLFAVKEDTFAALATVKPAHPPDREWVAAICDENTVVASLGSLGTALNERIRGDMLRVFLPMMGLLILMLGIVFRSLKDLLLSLFSLAFAGAGLALLTIWTPMSWNSFNICGLPLLFGTGLDFSIHMIFALRRSGGNLAEAKEGIGKALLFCGTSSAIGFGSLATASAYGLASLGVVCAAGILINMVTAVWLVPRWYTWLHRPGG